MSPIYHLVRIISKLETFVLRRRRVTSKQIILEKIQRPSLLPRCQPKVVDTTCIFRNSSKDSMKTHQRRCNQIRHRLQASTEHQPFVVDSKTRHYRKVKIKHLVFIGKIKKPTLEHIHVPLRVEYLLRSFTKKLIKFQLKPFKAKLWQNS